MKRVRLEKKNLSFTLNDSNPKWIWAETNHSRAWGMLVKHKQVCSPSWGGMVPTSEHFFFKKHREHHLNFKICTASAAKALLESMKHSCKSHVKYSLGFSLRNHPEVCECARQHDWYIISVSGLWSWTWQSHDQIKRNDSIFLLFFLLLNIQ